MVKRVKRVLVLGVVALLASLVYAEGEQEVGSTAPKESVTVREEKKSAPAVRENSERHSEVEHRSVKREEPRNEKIEKKKKIEKSNEQVKTVNEKNLKDNKEKEVNNNKNKSVKVENSSSNNKPDPKRKVVKAIEHEQEGVSEYSGEVIKYIATTDGKVLKDKMSRQKHPIASLTKVMNILVTLDQVDRGNAKLDDKVCFTPETVNMGGSWLNAKAGDCYTLRDLLRAEIIYSANNAAYLVAYHIGHGNYDNFVKLMNEKAKELGMKDTHYYTPAGLPSSMTKKNMDISTAYDMYLLGKRAIRDERLRAWMKESELVLQNSEGEDVVYNNRNHLLEIGSKFKVKNAQQKEINGVLSSNVYQIDNTNYKFEVKDLQVTAEKQGISKGDIIGKLEVLSKDNQVVGTVDILAQNDYKQLSVFGRILRFVTFGMA